jgi:hypothetical protein
MMEDAMSTLVTVILAQTVTTAQMMLHVVMAAVAAAAVTRRRMILVDTQMMENATFLPTVTPGRTAQTVTHVEAVAAAA